MLDKPAVTDLQNIEIKLDDTADERSDGWDDEKEGSSKDDPMDYFKKK